jgi:hypothetical protein
MIDNTQTEFPGLPVLAAMYLINDVNFLQQQRMQAVLNSLSMPVVLSG